MNWLDRTFADALAWARDVHGDREAVVDASGEVRLTFTTLNREARVFARGLMALGVERGEHVALWMSDSVDWMIARWAVPMIGAVLVPINTRFRDADVRYVLAQSDTTTLIMEDTSPGGTRYVDLLAQVVPDLATQAAGAWNASALPALKRVIGRGPTIPSSMLDFEAIRDAGRATIDDGALEARLHTVRGDDVAQILYTSGTTSFPKGAMVCHGPLLQNNLATVARMRLTPIDRYLSCVPLFSATGTSYTLSMLLAGAAIVIADRFEPRLFCELVERERITVGFFVDTIVQDLRAFAHRGDYDLSTLRTGTGAPLSHDAFLYATETLGVDELIGVFGMSETSNAVARGDCTDPLERRASSNGRAVPGVELRIADLDTNATLPAGEMGEICVRGFNVMRGYYRQPEENAKAFDADGWLHSGDLGTIDADGYLVFRGRVKEMIKPGGFNVATQEIEAFLRTHPAVREAVVVGVPDARLGEVAYAYVERTPDAQATADELIAWAHAHIASYKVPRHVAFVTEWPRTGSQKIRKLSLRDRARASLAVSDEGKTP